MVFILCLLSLAVVGVHGYQSVPKETSIFLTQYNGDFNNIAQTALGFLRLQLRIIPVIVPALEGPVFYLETVFNGSILILQLGEVVDVYKNKIRVKLYDFVDYTNLKPLSYDVKKVSQLQPRQLRSEDNCFAFYEIKDNNSVTVSYPACKVVNNDGTYPRFKGTVDCRQYPVKFPVGVVEESLAVTYALVKGPRRYPLPQAYKSKDFVNPCEDSVVY